MFVDNDVDAALTDLHEAIRLTKSVGTNSIWAEQVLAITLILDARPEARRELARIIAAAYDQRTWVVVDTLLDLPPAVLISTDPEAAAVVFGYCEQRPGAWGAIVAQSVAAVSNSDPERRQSCSDMRAARPAVGRLTRQGVNKQTGATPTPPQARGAAMDRHEIVAFTLAALAEP